MMSNLRIDYSIPLGTIILVSLQLIGIVFAVMKTYAATQAALVTKFAEIDSAIASKFNQVELAMNTFKEGDLRELKASVLRLETGQDEWTKTLRQRTHQLTDEVNALKLKVDRLERPMRYPTRDHQTAEEA